MGDVGDFGKYGLLNEIYNHSNGNIKLGVNWYKVSKEEDNNDGKHIDYLEDNFKAKASYIRCFPELYDQLKGIVQNNNRTLSEIERSKICLKTLFFILMQYLIQHLILKEENWKELTGLKIH